MKNRFFNEILPCSLLLIGLFIVGCKRVPEQRPLLSNPAKVIPYTAGATFSMQDSAGNVRTYTCELIEEQWLDREETVEGRTKEYEIQQRLYELVDVNDGAHLTLTLTAKTAGTVDEIHFFYPYKSLGTYAEPGDCPFGTVACANSDTIRGVVYDQVFSFRFVDGIAAIWYNPTQGFLKYIGDDGVAWELVP